MTKVLELYAFLLTTWAEKTECLKAMPAMEEALDVTTFAMALVRELVPWTEVSNGELGVLIRAKSCWYCSGVKTGVVEPEAIRNDKFWDCG